MIQTGTLLYKHTWWVTRALRLACGNDTKEPNNFIVVDETRIQEYHYSMTVQYKEL